MLPLVRAAIVRAASSSSGRGPASFSLARGLKQRKRPVTCTALSVVLVHLRGWWRGTEGWPRMRHHGLSKEQQRKRRDRVEQHSVKVRAIMSNHQHFFDFLFVTYPVPILSEGDVIILGGRCFAEVS